MNNNVIELKGVTKSFKKNNVKVLKNINFVFKKGKIYSLTGPSGSGKSTLLNILSMIDRPTRGNLFINTKKINFDKIEINDQIRARNIGIIYQDSNLLSDFNALENIIISRLAIENNEKKAIFDAKKLLKKFKLLKRSSHFPNELSGGESQRIAISRALINSPDIIMADEPSGSLDNKNSKDVFKSLFQLKNKNRVIIFATHNMYFAKMADCKLELDNGIIKSTNG
tara:strand:- start:535 stop:1212 length:678 start_codon:yes stop_codon:yes gene_type:complete